MRWMAEQLRSIGEVAGMTLVLRGCHTPGTVNLHEHGVQV